MPENKQELLDLGQDCGLNTSAPFASYDHDTLSWKTLQPSLTEDSPAYLDRWPRSGTMRNGIVSEQTMLVPPTNEIACGCLPILNGTPRAWPTPAARDGKGGYIGGRIRNGKVSWDTLDVAVQHMSNQDKSGGQLNPRWVEWLMGYPVGWLNLKDWATPSSPSVPLLSTKKSLDEKEQDDNA